MHYLVPCSLKYSTVDHLTVVCYLLVIGLDLLPHLDLAAALDYLLQVQSLELRKTNLFHVYLDLISKQIICTKILFVHFSKFAYQHLIM